MQTPNVGRIALLGGESSGKTTLARALAVALNTEWVPEYGRELWEQLRRTLTQAELLQVGEQQVQREEEATLRCAKTGAPWLICDTTALTTLQYCLHDHGQAPAHLERLAQRPYALTVLCEPDFDFVQDGCRRDDGFRQAQRAWTVQRLAAMNQTVLAVQGSTDHRVAMVQAALRTLEAQPHKPIESI